MSSVLNKIDKNRYKVIAFRGGLFVLFCLIISIIFFVFDYYYFKDKIAPGVWVGNSEIGFLTLDDARLSLEKVGFSLDKKGLTFRVVDNFGNILDTVTIDSYTEIDDIQDVFSIDIEATLAKAYSFGHDGFFFNRIRDQVSGIFSPHKISFIYTFRKESIESFLMDRYKKYGFFNYPRNSELKVKMVNDIDYEISLTQSDNGGTLNLNGVLDKCLLDLAEGNSSVCKIVYQEVPPLISSDVASLVTDHFDRIIKRGSIILTDGLVSWDISPKIYGEWLEIIYDNGSVFLDFSDHYIEDYLRSYIEPAVIREPVNARFQMKDSKVTLFKSSQLGQRLIISDTITKLEETFFNEGRNSVELVLEASKPLIETEDVNNFGIRELIGIGRSNFAGSPTNRRHNIAVGAAAVNGTIIAPGEEFSLLKVLGVINKESGYLEELVIKGDKTVPEYGGGLCQIGTTTFRGALDAGLPITERRNHSYQVSYYKPAGTDATIYDPAPDFKFLNDTGHHILILTKIEGNELIYEFWGTRDGRKSIVGEPRIYNIIKPPPGKMIETDELPPGEKKCTERAHDGATAELSRTVIYPDGNEVVQSWKSVYRPWQEVCLIGKEVKPEF